MNDNSLVRVPYSMSVHGEEEISACLKVLRTTTQMGKHVAEFESKIAEWFHKRIGVFVNSDSSALYLSIEALFTTYQELSDRYRVRIGAIGSPVVAI